MYNETLFIVKKEKYFWCVCVGGGGGVGGEEVLNVNRYAPHYHSLEKDG